MMPDKKTSRRTSPEEFTERLRKLIAANLAGNAELLNRFNELIRDAPMELGARRAGESSDAQSLLSRWLDFNLASYAAMSTHGLALLNGLLSAAEDAMGPPVAKPRVSRRASKKTRPERVQRELSTQ
jgi:hypothetical protein